jgi:hypothetical protein
MDNYFKGCPPRMNDGRFITDYRSADNVNLHIMAINGIRRDDDYRCFLQNNAQRIMDNQWNLAKKTQSCQTNACLHNYPTRTNLNMQREELQLYNAVRTNRVKNGDSNYPVCRNGPDYRASKNC